MFGYRRLGQLDEALLTCAVEGPLGTVWVGCSGAKPGFETLSQGRWPTTYAPALFRLEDESFIPHDDFDDDDRWVDALLADDTGVWVAGGRGIEGKLWRMESGVVVYEIAATTPSGADPEELAELGDDLYLLAQDGLLKKQEMSTAYILTSNYMPECALTALRDRVYWLTEYGETAWYDGERQGGADNDIIIKPNGMCVYQDRLWGIKSNGIGSGLGAGGAEAGNRPVISTGETDPTQELAWFDGYEWRSVARWHAYDSGIYFRLASFGNRLWLFGELWDEDTGEPAEQPCAGRWDGQELRLGQAWPYWVDRVTTGDRRALMVGDEEWYPNWIIGGFPTLWDGPSCVIAADVDLRVEAVIQEFGDGTGESPVVASVSQEFGDGSGEGPIVTDVWQEFGDGASGPETGEKILWLEEDDEGECVALRVTTDLQPSDEAQLRGLVRCDKEHLAVGDYDTYQQFELGRKVTIEEPGGKLRIGIIKPDSIDDETVVHVQLLRQ